MEPFQVVRRALRFVGFASGGLLAASVATSTALRLVIRATESRRMKSAPRCSVCKGEKKYPCRLCKDKGTLDWSPLLDPVFKRPVLCPTCDGTKVQKCLNCLGKGYA